MECETISDFEQWATGELRAILTEAGFDRPELYRVVVSFPEPGGSDPRDMSVTQAEAARYLAEVMQVPVEMFGVVEDQEPEMTRGG